LGWACGLYGEKKKWFVLLLIDLSVQEIICISQQQDEDAKGQIAAKARRQNT
jgi:hypothetical protein